MIHPACQLCRGACCEMFRLPLSIMDTGDDRRWLSYRGQPSPGRPGFVVFDCPCEKLADGQCSIYEQRPLACKVFPVGGPGCREAVAMRRAGMVDAIVQRMP